MILSAKSLKMLREMINEKTEYRSGPVLINFFNGFGFNESYGQGFPSRWAFTDECLKKINGTQTLDQCIKQVFSPVNFINRLPELDNLLKEFNQYLAFDKWRVIREGAEISLKALDKIILEEDAATMHENGFLTKEFSSVSIDSFGLDSAVVSVLKYRIVEIEKCFYASSPLAVILLAGSTLEGILLGLAIQYPRHFNSATAAPKDAFGKVRLFQDWSLASFIDVAKELSLFQQDTYKFSHSLRDFRNYIHPFEQIAAGFEPRENTAKICLQVLKSAIYDLHENIDCLRS